MRSSERMLVLCSIVGLMGLAHGRDANGLATTADDAWPRWQGRASLAPTDLTPGAGQGLQPRTRGEPASLALLTDYYVTRSFLGPTRAGGFRATSGIMVGPRSQASTGLLSAAPGSAFGGDRRFPTWSSLPGDSAADAPTLPYLGVGYTGLSLQGGWRFTADVGLLSLNRGAAVKLGRTFTGAQSLDDAVRDMRWSPVLQLGVSYRF
jgi:hypothetical protein